MRRTAGLALGGLLAGVLAVAAFMRAVPDDPAIWHVDPLRAERTGRPNEWLIAPADMAAAPPDRIAEVQPIPPAELMARFDAVAMQTPRTRRIAGGKAALTATCAALAPVRVSRLHLGARGRRPGRRGAGSLVARAVRAR